LLLLLHLLTFLLKLGNNHLPKVVDPTNAIHSFPSLLTVQHIRVIHKVRKTQHQNPEFGHREGEIQKSLQKSKLAFKGG
jgi:hypothetical protein